MKVGKTSDVEPGTAKAFEVDGRSVAVCNVDGTYYAIDDVCTHDGGPLDQGLLDGTQIECPRHGARFDVTTGRALTLPAVMPVNAYPVRVEGDDIEVSLS
ncbi:MAG: non-heme iron oxygenase ferredoxin subunit [Dehalococcoidia bacterium]